MHVERLGVAEVVAAPDPVDELTAGEHTARVAHEHLEQLELLQRHIDLFAGDGHGVPIDVERDAATLENALVQVALGLHDTAQHRPHAGEQFAR